MNDGKSDTNEVQNPGGGSTAGSPNQSQSEREDKISPDIPELLQNALNTTPDEKDGQDTSGRHVPEASAGREISECNSKSNVKETTSSRDIPAPISNTNPKTDMSGTMATDSRPGEVEPLRPANYYSMSSVGSLACRICHTSEDPERLISPCLCKGTMAYVHRHCLEHWLTTSGMLSCELCNFRFRIEQTLRYSVCQSIRIWYRHPNHRGLLQADFLVCSLLTVVSFGLIGICMLGLQYFVLQGRRMGISRLWTQGSIIVFLVIVAFVYCVNLFLILKSQLVPWYRWWQSVRDIRLILFDRRPIHRLLAKKKPMVASEEVELQSTVLSGQTTAIETRNTTVIAIN